jgi:Protein of unknown function (DUF4238)
LVRSDNPPETRNPWTAGRRRSFYIRGAKGVESDGIETFFSREVESSYAGLAQRIKNEREKFTNLSIAEVGAILRFVASQAVRTPAHHQCVDEQAGRPLDKHVFFNVMLRQMRRMCEVWATAPPKLLFFTTLPYVGEHFISGSHSVVVIQVRDNQVWTPITDPSPQISNLNDILLSPRYGFFRRLIFVCRCRLLTVT